MKRMILVLLACSPTLALAVTYKCTDAQGRVTYSQTVEPGQRCVAADLPPVPNVSPQAPLQPASRAAGTEPKATQPQAAGQDLAAAKKSLDEARKRLAEQEAVRHGDEKNYQRVLDRLKPYQDEVARAEERVRQLGGTP